jgi:hypothetical protein
MTVPLHKGRIFFYFSLAFGVRRREVSRKTLFCLLIPIGIACVNPVPLAGFARDSALPTTAGNVFSRFLEGWLWKMEASQKARSLHAGDVDSLSRPAYNSEFQRERA